MFIWTIGDIAAVIIFVIFIGVAIVERIDSAWYARPHKEEPKAEPKPEPKKEPEHGPNDKYAYFLLAVFAIAIAIVFIAMANSPSQ